MLYVSISEPESVGLASQAPQLFPETHIVPPSVSSSTTTFDQNKPCAKVRKIK